MLGLCVVAGRPGRGHTSTSILYQVTHGRYHRTTSPVETSKNSRVVLGWMTEGLARATSSVSNTIYEFKFDSLACRRGHHRIREKRRHAKFCFVNAYHPFQILALGVNGFYIMDPNTLLWTPGPNLPWPCLKNSAIHIIDDRVYIVGKCNGASVEGLWSLYLNGTGSQQHRAVFWSYPIAILKLVMVPKEIFQMYSCA